MWRQFRCHQSRSQYVRSVGRRYLQGDRLRLRSRLRISRITGRTSERRVTRGACKDSLGLMCRTARAERLPDFGRSVENRGDVPSKDLAGNANPGRWDVAGATYNLGEERTQVVSVRNCAQISCTYQIGVISFSHGTEGTRRGDSQEIPSVAEGAGRTAAAALGGDGSASVAAWRGVAGRASHGPVPEHDPYGDA